MKCSLCSEPYTETKGMQKLKALKEWMVICPDCAWAIRFDIVRLAGKIKRLQAKKRTG